STVTVSGITQVPTDLPVKGVADLVVWRDRQPTSIRSMARPRVAGAFTDETHPHLFGCFRGWRQAHLPHAATVIGATTVMAGSSSAVTASLNAAAVTRPADRTGSRNFSRVSRRKWAASGWPARTIGQRPSASTLRSPTAVRSWRARRPYSHSTGVVSSRCRIAAITTLQNAGGLLAPYMVTKSGSSIRT